jgi:hypothetical protein
MTSTTIGCKSPIREARVPTVGPSKACAAQQHFEGKMRGEIKADVFETESVLPSCHSDHMTLGQATWKCLRFERNSPSVEGD